LPPWAVRSVIMVLPERIAGVPVEHDHAVPGAIAAIPRPRRPGGGRVDLGDEGPGRKLEVADERLGRWPCADHQHVPGHHGHGVRDDHLIRAEVAARPAQRAGNRVKGQQVKLNSWPVQAFSRVMYAQRVGVRGRLDRLCL
jgi:hypothetical protein